MPKLKLVLLQCQMPDDLSENNNYLDTGVEDEPYILANKRKVWSGQMGVLDVEDLSEVEPIKFEENIRLELWDRDAGYAKNRDDPLGNITINASKRGRGVLSHRFKRRKAEYLLKYKVE